MATKPKNSARLDFRLSPEQKELIEQAAFAVGQSVSDFATSTLLQRARQAMEESNLTTLSNRDRDIFMAMLDDESEPNAALRKAAQRYQQGG